MKSIKLFLTIIAAFTAISSIQAQDLINLVPNQTTFVGVIDMNQINTKANIAELIKLPVFNKMDKEVGKELFGIFDDSDSTSYLDLQKHGISKNNKTYFYIKNADNIYYGAMVLNIEDEAKFTNFAEMLTSNEEGKNTIISNNYKYAQKNKLRIVWNSKSAAFFGVTISPAYKDSISTSIRSQYDVPATDYYNYTDVDTSYLYNNDAPVVEDPIVETPDYEEPVDDFAVADTTGYDYNDYEAADTTSGYNYEEPYIDPYTNSYNIISATCDSIENAWCTSNAGIILQDKGANTLANNLEFMEYLKTNPDAACVFDYGQFMDMTMKAMQGMAFSSFTNGLGNEYLKGFYQGLNMFAKVEMNKDDIKFIIDMKHSEKLNEIYKEVKKTKISNKYLKYMDNGLMGYYAAGIDIAGLSKGIGNSLKGIYTTVPKYGTIVSSAMEVIDIFIDEQAIYNVFTGDMVLAVNGVKPVEVISKTYDYDENYNMTERMDTTMQMQPEILFMLGVGNLADVNKILKLFVSFELLKQEGNLYTASYKNSDLPVYFKIQDEILFISNNKNYVAQPQVYAKDKQLGKEHTKMFKENTYIAYANTSKIAQYFAKQGSSENEKMLTQSANLFTSAKMTGKTKNGYSSASCVFELSKSSDNSIVDILKFINDLYIFKEKKL